MGRLGKLRKWVLALLERRLFPVYFSLYLCFFLVFDWIHEFRIRKVQRARRLYERNLSRLKSCDTLFVLGSGSSITRFGGKEWDVISRGDSVGLNFWLIHEFVPTFLVIEVPRDPKIAHILFELLRIRMKDYADRPILLKGVQTAAKLTRMILPPDVRRNLCVASGLTIPGESEAGFHRALRYMKRLGFMTLAPGVRGLLKKRASLSYAVHLGVLLGYKRIVLCGVDLGKPTYFYDDWRSHYEGQGLPVPHPAQEGQIHKTIDPAWGALTIDKVLYVMNDVLLKPLGIELLVGSESSRLYPALPCYKWE